jgi:acyl-CoA thioesterase I
MYPSKRAKQLLVTGALLAVLVFVWIWWQGKSYPITNYPPTSDGPVVAFGDSLVSGYGSSSGGFVSLLSQSIGEAIMNLGVPGDTTEGGVSRVEELLRLQPRVVLVLLGGNDYLKRRPKEETFDNLSLIIGRIQDSGAVVVLLGVRGGVLGDNFDKEFKRLAKETGSAFVPNVLKGIIGVSEYMSDQVHPNDTGYQIIAERILPVLLGVL